MKHVFVETNFLIEVLRPKPEPAAERLLERQRTGELQLHVPWCSVTEAKRTLEKIIFDDLGFPSGMASFAARAYQEKQLDATEKQATDKLKMLAERAREEEVRSKNARVDALAKEMQVISPSPEVIDRTLRLFDTKSLKPFDEMALGAILARAAGLYRQGERELYFCTTDKKDLGPSDRRPQLKAAYDACGLVFRDQFTL